ncbi:EF-P beta-lysylation protein EpmB [Saccharophagus sp. K07]|jgi:EF-P beta-lysylation protein EpmB|uniref:EF-P beta-lysylation protein EpmB n=1 Tax=Saccharophagus sp. K07 TaxID=2283636 RepID=UPI0016520A82|nr:EF-P beta-lysylation protein EpmB [Saccharophagus sp. K07]MBC6904176.1 EF-P beta-lysylation protein EpmB [Saccharophagus sp. K07]
MIPRTVPTWQTKSWQEELSDLIQDPAILLERLQLGPEWLKPALDASIHFPLRATESYVSRIRPGDPQDPLLLQILPLAEELKPAPDYQKDPLEEARFTPVPGLVHKYQSRVLLVAATQCAINCRYCFRRHFPYEEHQLSRPEWLAALDYIRRAPEINEVILSGGDPLSLSDKQLGWLVENIGNIPHIKRLRIHSRYPIILPSRITPELLKAIHHPRLKTVMVMHCNHAQEIDGNVHDAVKAMRGADILVLNQAVLLKKINDNSRILATLSESLFDAGVLPYYLHLLDKVQGAAHFAVAEDRARELYGELLTLLPGFLVPKLVRETPDEGSKTPIPPL